MAHLLIPPKLAFFDLNGDPLAGGKLYTYAAGTSTPLATYTDQTEVTPNTNPIILDSKGECVVWIGALAYKIVLKDADGVTLWTQDNISSINIGSISTAMLADGSVTTAKIADIAVTTAKIDNLNVTTAKIAASAITTAKILDSNVTTEKIADANVTTAKIADANVTLAKLASDVAPALKLGKNKILNGDFKFWQRGTSFSVASGGTPYTADMWQFVSNTTGTISATQSTDIPTVAQAGKRFPFSLLMQPTVAEASLGVGSFAYIRHAVDFLDCVGLYEKTCTLSFWVKASKTGVYGVSLFFPAAGKSLATTYTISSANTWVKQSISLAAFPTLVSTTDRLSLYFSLCSTSGSGLQTSTLSSWQSSTLKTSSSSQANFMDSTSNVLYLTGIQLETGDVATEFEEVPYGLRFMQAKQYYEVVVAGFYGYNPNVAATAAIGGFVPWTVEKRANGSAALSAQSYTLCNTGTINFYLNGVQRGTDVSANFITGSAGAAKFQTTITGDFPI